MQQSLEGEEPKRSRLIGRTKRKSRRRRRGQAVVEFALILPVFLLLTLGIVDVSRIYSSYIALTDGVREAALFAADGANNAGWWCTTDDPAGPTKITCPPEATAGNKHEPENIAHRLEATGLEISEITMSMPVCSPNPLDCATATKVKIEATYEVPMLTPVLSQILGGKIDMTVSTTARIIK